MWVWSFVAPFNHPFHILVFPPGVSVLCRYGQQQKDAAESVPVHTKVISDNDGRDDDCYMFMIGGGEHGGDDGDGGNIDDDVDENSDGDKDNHKNDNHVNVDDKNKESTAATLINGETTARAVRLDRLTTGYCHQ